MELLNRVALAQIAQHLTDSLFRASSVWCFACVHVNSYEGWFKEDKRHGKGTLNLAGGGRCVSLPRFVVSFLSCPPDV